LGLLEDGDDLAVGETGCLHGTSSEKGTRKFHFWRQLTCGGITHPAVPRIERAGVVMPVTVHATTARWQDAYACRSTHFRVIFPGS
ncbi:hypothetical protein VWZ13_22750, partial [Xanthomonas citri pv. citri]